MSVRNRLSAPFPYSGAKGRVAGIINERLGKVDVYVEPFAGSLAVLLSRDPVAREIVCDLDGMIANFWRAVAHDPGAVAVWADWPTFHDDLTARHRWLIAWKRKNSRRLAEDPEFYSAKAAGWWVWGISIWIGGGFCSDQPTRRPGSVPESVRERGVNVQRDGIPCVGDHPGRNTRGVSVHRQDTNPGVQRDSRPRVGDHPGRTAQGVSVHRRDTNPHDFIPKTNTKPAGSGVSVQRTEARDSRPRIDNKIGGDGRGVSVHRSELRDDIPRIKSNPGGDGVDVQKIGLRDSIPFVTHRSTGGQGVDVQRPTLRDGIPHVDPRTGGKGISQQVNRLRDVRPHVGGASCGQGVSQQVNRLRDGRPHVGREIGGQGVQPQRGTLPRPTGTRGDRLIPWMLRLAARLERVIVLRRDWSSAVTPTLLTHTDAGPKKPVGILLDPPYKTAGRSKTLYGREDQSDQAAVASYEWAVKHGGKYRIVYCCHDGDFPLPDGWTKHVSDFAGVRNAKRRAERKDCLMFSPACPPTAQRGLF